MHADGIGRHCGNNFLVESEGWTDEEVPLVVPHIIVVCEETTFVMATRGLSLLFPPIEWTEVSALPE
jgi:uncharacterized membrane protein YukC